MNCGLLMDKELDANFAKHRISVVSQLSIWQEYLDFLWRKKAIALFINIQQMTNVSNTNYTRWNSRAILTIRPTCFHSYAYNKNKTAKDMENFWRFISYDWPD